MDPKPPETGERSQQSGLFLWLFYLVWIATSYFWERHVTWLEGRVIDHVVTLPEWQTISDSARIGSAVLPLTAPLRLMFWTFRSLWDAATLVVLFPILLTFARGKMNDGKPWSTLPERTPLLLILLLAVQAISDQSRHVGYSMTVLASLVMIVCFVILDTRLGLLHAIAYTWRLLIGLRLASTTVVSIVLLAICCAPGTFIPTERLPPFAFALMITPLAYVQLSGRRQAGLPDPAPY